MGLKEGIMIHLVASTKLVITKRQINPEIKCDVEVIYLAKPPKNDIIILPINSVII